ncbi:MAG: hypothetical protein DMG64_02865 [Acidobacteria bacterium]|nr:MAG: hypothetical protein DMG64_02865 [Acidobacteriota bacterium]PYY23301.1 MAG: hypothetical protein DMG62_09435 [Acidobacteriota bacterium]
MKSAFYVRSVCVSVFLFVCLTPNSWGSTPSGTGPAADSASSEATIQIPGPLRSFLRMAGISQKAAPDEVLPLLARNVFLLGYEGPSSHTRPTEFLILLSRYVQQARELDVMAGAEGVLRVANCEQARPLLQVLGYRTRTDCGQAGSYLETADPQRAFVTIDSGFPIPELEKTLQGGPAFSYAFRSSRVPMLFTEADWTGNKNLIDALIRDSSLSRLYWAFAQMDPDTQLALRQSPGLKRLAAYGPVLDFYGSRIRFKSGHVVVPGGTSAEGAWKDLAGVGPDAGGEFVAKLVAKDNGWLAAYFDALSRVNRTQQAHFTESRRLKPFYEALRHHEAPPAEAARSVFRPAPGLLLLLTRMEWESNGEPRVPGNLEVWKRVLRQKNYAEVTRDWGKKAHGWNNSEQLLEALVAISRVDTEVGPLQAYLMLTELDGGRGAHHRLSAETVWLMASKFSKFGDQYLLFAEFPSLDDASITAFLNAAERLDNLPNHYLRGNALGTFQSGIGLWQIFARQNQIPKKDLNASFQRIIAPFDKVAGSSGVFDAGRSSLRELMVAATGRPEASQGELIDLLAGPQQSTPEGQRMHQEVATRMRSVLDAQRLVSLDTLITLGDGLQDVDHVKASSARLTSLAGQLREFEMPQPIFKKSEREEWGAGVYNNRHTDLEMQTDLSKVVRQPASADQVVQARGQLASFLRDTMVGLNYAYYEPPGAQILHHNPLFVRSHDFSGDTVVGMQRASWRAPQLFGAGSPAGGGAHLVGSLADLPYVLAQAEQDFITPENVQALIWGAVVPGILTSAIVPRWWDVSKNELHAVTLYQQAGEELLTASQNNEDVRNKVIEILSERLAPKSVDRVQRALRTARGPDALIRVTPADSFYLAAEFSQRYPDQAGLLGQPGKDLQNLAQQYPNEVSWERLSRDFGVPHPVLAQSYARELLNLPPFPAFMGYSSRFLAESWDSNNLYWARLADEKEYSPVMLNRLVPELTRRMVEKIFATDLEDWPALLRATRETGDEFRQGKVNSVMEASNAQPRN